MSVTQLTVAATAAVGLKAVNTGQPDWLAAKMLPCRETRTAKGTVAIQRARTNIRHESLLMKASKAYNMLPQDIKSLDQGRSSKRVKLWCQQAVPQKPP